MAEKQSTFGEFIDIMEKFAKETRIYDASFFIEDIRMNAKEEQWDIQAPLTRDQVIAFAQDMASFFSRRLDGICTDELYTSTHKQGHVFLQTIHQKATELGIKVELGQIDLPLTPSDLLVGAGLAETKDGKIRLTPKGEKLAMEAEEKFTGAKQ